MDEEHTGRTEKVELKQQMEKRWLQEGTEGVIKARFNKNEHFLG